MSLFRGTIWERGLLDLEPDQKFLKRVILPLFDTFLVCAGLGAVRGEIAGFSEVFPEHVADALAYSFTAIAALCLVGVAVPRLGKLEIFAKIGLVTILGMYFGSLAILNAISISGARGFVAGLVAALMMLPFYRLRQLALEDRDRRPPRRR